MSSDDTARFALALEDETSKPALEAAHALKALKAQLDADTGALREVRTAMAAMKGTTAANSKEFRDLKAKSLALKESIGQNAQKFAALGGVFKKTASSAHPLEAELRKLLADVRAAPGPLGSMAGGLGELAGLLASPVGLLTAIAGGMLALAGAAVVATASLLRYGIAQSDVRRTELLRLEGLTTIRRWHGLAAESAEHLQGAIDRVSDSTAAGRGDLERYTAQLYRAGLRGQNLQDALEGVATVAQVQGEGRAMRFAQMAAGANLAGHSVRRLADDVKARLGGIARRQMLSLDVQSQKLHERLDRIFSGLRIEGFLGALNEVTSLFSQSTATGRALKTIVETMFNPLLDAMGSGAPLVKRFFQGMVIGALQLALVIVRTRNWLHRTFGDASLFRGLDAGKLAVYGGIAVVGAFVGVLLGLAAVAGVVAASVTLLVAPFVLIAGAVAAVIAGVMKLGDYLAGFRGVFRSAGDSLVAGLVEGLASGRDRIVGSVRGLANDATSALRDVLQIRSPSRVFADLGTQIPRGLAAGISEGADAATGAVEGLAGDAADAAPGGRGAGGAARSLSIGEIHIHTAATDARGIAEELRQKLAEVFEGLALQTGAPVGAT